MTLGVFDAIHEGHQALISNVRAEGARLGVPTLVFTFERHPLALLAPPRCPATILQPSAKAAHFGALGVDLCLILPFREEIARITADEFAKDVLAGRCRARHITCGPNFHFGRGGEGDVRFLREAGERLGFGVTVMEPIHSAAGMVSSSLIRTTLLEGRVRDAAKMLTRPYTISAEVVGGDRRGRTIGYPTANLRPPADQLIPADGVYAVRVRTPLDDRRREWGGMLNIGKRPTFEGAGPSTEVHIFDFCGDLIGRTIDVSFVRRIRDERKFNGVDSLVAQLRNDESECRELLTGNGEETRATESAAADGLPNRT